MTALVVVALFALALFVAVAVGTWRADRADATFTRDDLRASAVATDLSLGEDGSGSVASGAARDARGTRPPGGPTT